MKYSGHWREAGAGVGAKLTGVKPCFWPVGFLSKVAGIVDNRNLALPGRQRYHRGQDRKKCLAHVVFTNRTWEQARCRIERCIPCTAAVSLGQLLSLLDTQNKERCSLFTIRAISPCRSFLRIA